MTIPNPKHLLQQAEALIAVSSAGAPRQVDIRRAISAAYYALFHAVVTAAADQVIGATKRGISRYGLVYRSIDHKSIRELCSELGKSSPPSRYVGHFPPGGFGAHLTVFAEAFVDLQVKRHSADYDPLIRVKRSDALLAISSGRGALSRFESAPPIEREIFLTLLLFRPR